MAEEIIKENFLPEAQGVYGDPEPKPKKYLKKIHENLIEAYGKDQVPDEAAFAAKMKDTAYVRLIHENLVDAFGKNEVPDLNLFNSKLINDGDVKKKDGTKALGFSQYDFLNVGKPSSRTQLPLVGEYSQVQESKAAPKATPKVEKSSNSDIQNVLGFIKSGGKATKSGGKTTQVAKSTQPTVSQNVREQAALGRLGKALVDPVTGTKIDRKTGLPTAYTNELNKQSTFKAPQISEEDKSIYLQSLGLNPNTTDVEVVNTPDFKQFKQTVDQEKKINAAIDNYWKRQDEIDMQKRAGFSGPFVSSRTSGAAFEQDLRNKIKSGDLVITNDEVTGEPIIGKAESNPITAFLNLYNKSYDQKVEEEYTQNLSPADKIKHKEVKEYLASRNNDFPSVPSGFFANAAAVGGTFAQALAKPTMTAIGLLTAGGALGAPFLGTEASFAAAQGLRNVGDVAGWMDQMGNDSYEPTFERTYSGIIGGIENPTYQQKLDAANKATEAATYAKSVGALEGMFFGIPLAKLGPSIAPSVGGYLNTLKSIGRNSLAQMPQMTGAAFLGEVGKGEIGKQYGSNETHSEILQKGLESAWETAKFVGGMGLVHATQAAIPHAFALLTNPAESPSKALTSKAKAIVTKFPEDVVADVYGKAEQQGVIPPGKANEIIADLQNYKEAEAQVPKTVVDVDARDAIAGKLQKIDALDNELKATKVNARQEEIKQEKAKINNEIDNIYKGDDVLANEYDRDGIPLNQELPAPKKRPSFLPIEKAEALPAEELVRRQQEAPVIEGQEMVEVKPTEVKVEVKPIEVKEGVEPIRQLGTGANVYFENNKYRVNDNSKGKVLLNIEGKEEGGMAIANIEFDSPKEAVEVAKELSKIYPSGVPDAVLIDKVVEDIRNKIKVKPTEEISVYHGGGVGDLSKAEGDFYVSRDANQAREYAKGNKGSVQEFKINKNDIVGEEVVRKVITDLGLKSKEKGWDLSKELMLHEILDPRFETSLNDKDLAKLKDELIKRGYKAVEMMATDVTGSKRNINDILVLNPKETLKTEVKPTEVKKITKDYLRFTSYDDAQEWIKSKSKEYKSKNEFLTSQEYKDALPDINALYEIEKSDYSKKAKQAMDKSGVKISDRVIYDYVTPIGVETYSGQIIDRQGIPFVKFDEGQKTISGKQSVRWHKGFVKEVKTTEVKAEVKPTKVTKDDIEVEGLDSYTSTAKSGKFYNIFGKRKVGDGDEMWWIRFSRKNNTNTLGSARYRNEKGEEKVISLNELPKSLIEIYNNPVAEVKPTEVKAEIKPSEKKKEVFKNSQGNTVELENGKLIVKSKSREVLSDRASKKAIEEYADSIDYSKGEKAPEVPSEITDPKQASQYVIEESKNPLEIAQAYIAEERLPSEGNTKFQAIAEYGLGRVTTDSYKRFGDVNKMEPATKLRYLTKEGFTVDQRAEEISGKTGLDITPQDIIDYIDKYPKGDYKVMTELETNVALQAKDKFKNLTGLDLTPELANKVIDKELQKANKSQLDIIKEDYETAKQLEDAYWAEYKKTDGFTKESNIGEVNKPEAAPKPEKSLEKAYKDLTNIEKRQIINSKFEKLLEELKIEKICPTD